MTEIRGSGCSVVWSADGRYVDKRYDRRSTWFLDHRHDKYDRERRIGMLLRRQPPPVAHAALVAADRRRATLRFAAVDGQPYGPKYPTALSADDVDDLVSVAAAMSTYRPRARFAARFDLARRLRRAVNDQLIAPGVARVICEQAIREPPTFVFAHGDVTARNVLRSPDGPTLIDWEWAGWYPRGWELAFLWVTLIDLPDARSSVVQAVPTAELTWFWRSALLIELLHLSLPSLAPPSPFRRAHERCLKDLLDRTVSSQ